jgi:hypothetical protein
MRLPGVFLVLAFMGCGDNVVPEGDRMTTKASPTVTSSVGGSQVSRSKSFMLVTSVSPGDAKVQRNTKHTLTPGVGGE